MNRIRIKEKLHIHFGIHRTGTTSIHKHLLANAETLKKMGILYPELNVSHRHVKVAWQLISKKLPIYDLVKQIKSEITSDTKLIILSSEDFTLLRENHWLDVLSREFDLSGSLYLRRQDLWLESWYNQHIKWPWDKRLSVSTPSEFLNSINRFYWIDYDWLLTTITKFIPKNSLYVNVLERSSISDTTMDFLQHCDIDTSKINFFQLSNESISAAALEIVRRINLFYSQNDKGRRKIIQSLKQLQIDEDSGTKMVFDDEQIQAILNKYRASNRKVAQNYFNREELFQDEIKYGRKPVTISEDKVYKVYLPQLLKEVAQLC